MNFRAIPRMSCYAGCMASEEIHYDPGSPTMYKKITVLTRTYAPFDYKPPLTFC